MPAGRARRGGSVLGQQKKCRSRNIVEYDEEMFTIKNIHRRWSGNVRRTLNKTSAHGRDEPRDAGKNPDASRRADDIGWDSDHVCPSDRVGKTPILLSYASPRKVTQPDFRLGRRPQPGICGRA
jgi:hypothetical protein